MPEKLTQTIGHLVGIEDVTTISDGYALLLTSVFIILGWHISNLISINIEMNKNTYALGEITADIKLNQEIRSISRNLNERVPFPPRAQMDQAERATVANILRHMEYLSTATSVGYLSERYLFLINGSMISLIYIISISYILEMRSLRSIKTFYRNFEMLYVRNFLETRSILIHILEIISGKKLFLLSYAEFRMHYYFVRLLFWLPKKYTDANQYELRRIYKYYKWGSRAISFYLVILYSQI